MDIIRKNLTEIDTNHATEVPVNKSKKHYVGVTGLVKIATEQTGFNAHNRGINSES